MFCYALLYFIFSHMQKNERHYKAHQGATENASTENASTNLSKCAMANSFFVDK